MVLALMPITADEAWRIIVSCRARGGIRTRFARGDEKGRLLMFRVAPARSVILAYAAEQFYVATRGRREVTHAA